MPQPTRSDVHVNKPMTNISIAYIQDAGDFVADKVFPNIPVMKQSDLYFQYDKKAWFQTQAQRRAPGTESQGTGYKVSATNSYMALVDAVHHDIPDQIRDNADQPLDMDRDATRFVTQQLLLKREIDFANKYMKTGIWQGFLSGGNPVDFVPGTNGGGIWSSSTSTPITDIDNLKADVKGQTGFMPNTLVLSRDTFTALKNNSTILDRIKYTQRGVVTAELLANLFDLQRVLIMDATVDGGAEGLTASMAFLVTNMALLCYAAPQPSLLAPSAGYTFSWRGQYGAGAQGNRIKTFRMEHLASDRVEGEMAYDMKQVGADLGVLINHTVS